MAEPLIPVIPNGFYVYEVLLDDQVRYVGKGTGRRFKNHVSTAQRYDRYMREGRSVTFSPFYTKLLIAIGSGAVISYRIVGKFSSDQDALAKEIEHIASFPPEQLWNDGPGGNGGTSKGAIRRWMDPAERDAHRARLKAVWAADPAVRVRHRESLNHRIVNRKLISNAAKARWSRPGEREAMAAFARKLRAERTAKRRALYYSELLSFGA